MKNQQENIYDYVPEAELESKDIEYKETLLFDDSTRSATTFAAMANGVGGRVFVGVRDDGVIIGLSREAYDKNRLRALSVFNNNLGTQVDYDFSKIRTKDARKPYILVVEIKPSASIVAFRLGQNLERVYVRDDGQTREASLDEILDLSSRRPRNPFDTEMTDILFRKEDFLDFFSTYREFHEGRELVDMDLLKSRGFMDGEGRLSKAGWLFSDRCDFPNMNIMASIWPEMDKGSDLLEDKREFWGSMTQLYHQAIRYIAQNSRQGILKTGAGSVPTASFPPVAVREAIVNALAHRDYRIDGAEIAMEIYPDRLVIASPGGWLLEVKPEDAKLEELYSKRRNKVICEIFEILGMMERRGSGFRKIAKAYRPYGDGKQPKLDYRNLFLSISLPNIYYRKEESKTVSVSDLVFPFPKKGNRSFFSVVVQACFEKPCSSRELMKLTTYTTSQGFRKAILDPLLKDGILLPTTALATSPYAKYFANPKMVKKV